MKHISKNLCALLLALAMLLELTATAYAADSVVTYKGYKVGFEFATGTGYHEADLFDGFKDVMPGDTLYETVTVKNEARDCDYIKVYLRAVPKDENGNPLVYDEAYEETDGKDDLDELTGRDETVATMMDFLKQLNMTVYNGEMKDENIIYQSTADQAGALAENVLLGTLRNSNELQLNVKLEVPDDLGNKYALRVGEVDWLFRVESFNDPTPPTGSLTVKKVWDDNRNKEGQRPEAIAVTLYKGNTPMETVYLSGKNGWTYTWNELDLNGDWCAVESVVPKGYYALYKRSGDSVTITNTTRLIQTGQMNWPIPVLAVLGAALILLGIAAVRKKRNHDEA